MKYYKTIGYMFNIWRTDGKDWWYHDDIEWVKFSKTPVFHDGLKQIPKDEMFLEMI